MKEKLIELIKKIDEIISPYKKNIIIPLLKIFAIIIICAIIARHLSGNETLKDYAGKNPDIAYPTTTTEEPTE